MQKVSTILFGLACLALARETAAAAPDPHDPEVERATFQLLPGFEVNLFAAEPWLVNPIHMTWDSQGRLWVCTSEAYPQVTPGEKPNDKIVVLEDTTGDGRADRHTVFADGLCVPTGLELADGGVYVANAPELLFLQDTTGDGRADVRRVVLSGFGTEDNHHSISAWRWGPDGWLYFQEGTFLHTQVETPYGIVRLENGGVLQFRPRQRRLQVFADYRASNPWGHAIDSWGQSILIDNPQIYFLAPATANSRLKPAYESLYREHTKLCGGDLVSGRHLPEEFRGEFWTNAYKVHGIFRYRFEPTGSGFAVLPQDPLLTSDSETFRPVDLKMGPDGAVYVADWYNPLIGHMQYEFRDPRRDKSHGRIWRISYPSRSLVERLPLHGMQLAELLEQLRAPEDWTRNQVKRELSMRDPDEAAAAIARWAASLDAGDPQFAHLQLEALWCSQTIDRADLNLLRQVLASAEPRARAAAVRTLRYHHEQLPDALDLLAAAVVDDDPRVRLEAVLSLSFLGDANAVTVACRVLDRPTDRFIDHALKLAIDGMQPIWLAEYRAQRLRFDSPAHEQFALSNARSAEAMGPLLAMLNSGTVDLDRLEALLPTVARQANAAELEPLWTRLTGTNSGGLASAATARLLSALESAARRRGVRPPGNLGGINRYLDPIDANICVAAIRLSAAWKMPGLPARLMPLLQTDAVAMPVRYAAAEALAEVGGAAGRRELELLAEGQSLADRYVGVVGLAAIDRSLAAPLAAAVLANDPGRRDPLPVVLAFVERRGGGEMLATALAAQRPDPRVAAAVLAWLNETGVYQPALADVLRTSGPGAELERQLLADDPMKLATESLALGDPVRGEQLFRTKALACQKCHPIGNAGPELGPDLSSLGASSPADYIVDSILRPSKAIKDQYQGAVVVTVDGRVLTGILAYQDASQVVLRDASQQGLPVTIPAAEIDEVAPSPKSLMPENLATMLGSRQEFLDLVRFLAVLGRPGPFQVDKQPYLRTWRVQACDASGVPLPETSPVSCYSRTDGCLPPAELAEAGSPTVLLSGQIDVLAGGNLNVRLNSATGVQALWLDDTPLALTGESATTRATDGIRRIALLVDLVRRGDEPIRVLIEPAQNEPARFQVVGGL